MSVFYLNKTSSFQIQSTGSLQRCPCRNVLTVANMKCYQVHHCSCLSLKCHGKRLLMVSHIIWTNQSHLYAGWIWKGRDIIVDTPLLQLLGSKVRYLICCRYTEIAFICAKSLSLNSPVVAFEGFYLLINEKLLELIVASLKAHKLIVQFSQK